MKQTGSEPAIAGIVWGRANRAITFDLYIYFIGPAWPNEQKT